uniref:Mitochondrial ATPase complex subunit ATP10 n=1 Tax=Tetraselmis sp. GSL018 TaxID=582737 RepID=A0A061QV53_9CHLO
MNKLLSPVKLASFSLRGAAGIASQVFDRSCYGSQSFRHFSSEGGERTGYFAWLRDVFSEERIRARKESLRDDLKRGYVNDLKDLRANNGKVFYAADKLAEPQASTVFPGLRLVSPSEAPVEVPARDGSVRAALVCIAFRNGAEEMLSTWREPFRERLAGQTFARVYDLSLVDSAVMGLWPFRGMIIRDATKNAGGPPPSVELAFHFGDSLEARKALGITNLLTGYVYLVDSRGLVRWRGSGRAEPWELEVMLKGAQRLLQNPPFKG